MQTNEFPSMGTWAAGPQPPSFTGEAILAVAHEVRSPAHVVLDPQRGRVGVSLSGKMLRPDQVNGKPTYPLLAVLPPLYTEWLGDRSFCEVH
ncbi:MAG: 2-nitropropane dioxygenase, partial [Polyangiaceae bacterium]